MLERKVFDEKKAYLVYSKRRNIENSENVEEKKLSPTKDDAKYDSHYSLSDYSPAKKIELPFSKLKKEFELGGLHFNVKSDCFIYCPKCNKISTLRELLNIDNMKHSYIDKIHKLYGDDWFEIVSAHNILFMIFIDEVLGANSIEIEPQCSINIRSNMYLHRLIAIAGIKCCNELRFKNTKPIYVLGSGAPFNNITLCNYEEKLVIFNKTKSINISVSDEPKIFVKEHIKRTVSINKISGYSYALHGGDIANCTFNFGMYFADMLGGFEKAEKIKILKSVMNFLGLDENHFLYQDTIKYLGNKRDVSDLKNRNLTRLSFYNRFKNLPENNYTIPSVNNFIKSNTRKKPYEILNSTINMKGDYADFLIQNKIPAKPKMKKYMANNLIYGFYYQILRNIGIEDENNIYRLFELGDDLQNIFLAKLSDIPSQMEYNMFFKKIIKYKGENGLTNGILLVYDEKNIRLRGWYIRDTIGFYARIRNHELFDETIFKKSFLKLHDEFQKIYKKVIRKPNRIIEYSPDEESFEDTYGDYQFKLPKDTFELSDVGDRMDICVGYLYDDLSVDKQCTIVYVQQNSIPIICIEIRKIKDVYEMVQIKGYHNRVIDGEEGKIVTKWAKSKNICGL